MLVIVGNCSYYLLICKTKNGLVTQMKCLLRLLRMSQLGVESKRLWKVVAVVKSGGDRWFFSWV